MKKEKLKEKLELKELPTKKTNDYQKISCLACDSAITADAININDKIAKCRSCNAIFSIQSVINKLSIPVRQRTEISRPEGIDLYHYKDDLEISLTPPYNVWEGLALMIIPFFALLLTFVFLVKGKAFIPMTISWLITLPLAYYFFQRSKDKVYLVLNDETLSIERRPKRLQKDQHFNVADIEQVYVKAVELFNVYMIVKTPQGSKHVKLISNIQNISKARYLEQEIERRLGIDDRPVPEEYVKPKSI